MRKYKCGSCFRHGDTVYCLMRVSGSNCMFIAVDGANIGNRWSEQLIPVSNGECTGTAINSDLGASSEYIGILRGAYVISPEPFEIKKEVRGLVDKEG